MGINPTFALAVGDATVVRFSYEYFDYDRVADRGIPSFEGRPFRTDESTFFGDPDQSPTHATVNQGALTIDHAFNDNLRLRNRTVYADFDKFYQNVYAGNAVDGGTDLVPLAAYNNEQLRENFFNQTDLTFSAETGSVGHDFLVGLELGEQVTENLRMTGLFNGTDLSFLVPATDPMVSVPVTFAPSEFDNDNRGRATIAAVYVQDQVQLSQKWLAVVGLRYDNFDMDFTDRRGAGTNIETSDDLVSPRGGLIYKPVENLSLYASYSMTYVPRSGAQLASLARRTRPSSRRSSRTSRSGPSGTSRRPCRSRRPCSSSTARTSSLPTPTTRACRCWSTASGPKASSSASAGRSTIPGVSRAATPTRTGT